MGQRQPTRTKSGEPAFSLIELLVVTAIISILVALILPSLQAAREQALSIRCRSNVHSIAQAASLYEAKYNEWLPGSPGTSGSVLLTKYRGRPGDDEDISEPPVQTWDFAGPLLAEQMGYRAVPANRGERFGVVVEGVFFCPSNLNLSMPFLTRSGPIGSFKIQKAVSYNTVRNFMMWPKVTLNGTPWGEVPPFHDDGNPAGWDGNISASSDTIIPRHYTPRIGRVGQPSEKIFVADSSRFTDFQGVSHNIHWRGADVGGAAGGAFSTGSPTLKDDKLRSYLTEEPQRSYAYRHPKGKQHGLSAVYFDGHAAWVSERSSRKPNAWYPKGTIIPADEFNTDTQAQVQNDLTPDSTYVVRR